MSVRQSTVSRPPELLVLQHPFRDKAIAPAILICRPMPVVKQKWLIWNSFERSAHNFECQLDDIAGPAASHRGMGISNWKLGVGSRELRTASCELSVVSLPRLQLLLPLRLPAFVFVTRGMKLNFRPLTTKTQPIGPSPPHFQFQFQLLTQSPS